MDTMRPKVAAPNNHVSDISKLEDEFNKTIVQYAVAYNLFSEAILNSNSINKSLQQFYGQSVTSSDGNYHYVNDYGFTHKYSADDWTSKSSTCSNRSITIDDDTYSQLKTGPDMAAGQPCGIAGTNIQNTTTGEYAWVDIKGYKHIYSSSLWENKVTTCKVPFKPLTSQEYESIPSGGNMTSTDTCMQLDIDIKIWNKITKLNQKLINLSKQLTVKLTNLVVDDVDKRVELKKSIDKMETHRLKLESQQKTIQDQSFKNISIYAKEEDAYLNQRMRYIHMMALLGILIIMIAYTYHSFVSPSTTTQDIVGGLGGLIILLFLLSKLYNYVR